MATNIPQDDFHKTGLRLPKDLHERLHEAAALSGRSYNSELVQRLQDSFEPKRDLEVLTRIMEDHLTKLEARIDTVQMRRDITLAQIDGVNVRMRLHAREATLAESRGKDAENVSLAEGAKAEYYAGEAELRVLVERLRQIDEEKDRLSLARAEYEREMAAVREELEHDQSVHRQHPLDEPVGQTGQSDEEASQEMRSTGRKHLTTKAAKRLKQADDSSEIKIPKGLPKVYR